MEEGFNDIVSMVWGRGGWTSIPSLVENLSPNAMRCHTLLAHVHVLYVFYVSLRFPGISGWRP